MIIGKIVSSTSHVDYFCQILRPGEAAELPAPQDYGFGRFVGIASESGGSLVAIVCNTSLLNPEFGSLGPRLSPTKDMAVFTPDYLAERVTLVALLVVGSLDANGVVTQGVPDCAAESDAPVQTLTDDQVRAFHQGESGLRVAYLPQLAALQTPLAGPLQERVIAALRALFPTQAAHLNVLCTNVAWRSRVQPAS